MNRLALALLILAVATLSACGAPTPQPNPEFEVTTVNPMVAKRTEAVTIMGAGFGSEAGVLIIGGVPADVISWGETEVRASVAANTPHAWQDFSLETAAGESITVPRFFVGVEYAGEADELSLAVDALDSDSALLLAAGTYELPAGAANLEFRRNGLYGHGEATTILRTPGYLRWTAASGQEVVIADLTIEADALEVSNAGLPVAATYPRPSPPRLVALHDSKLLIAGRLDLRADELDAGVFLENVTVVAPTASLDVDAMRGVTFRGSNLTAATVRIMATEGLVDFDDNDVTAAHSVRILADSLSAGVGLVTNNRIFVTGDEGPTLEISLLGGTCKIDDNRLEVIDASRDSSVSFKVACGITPADAPQVFSRNELTVLGDPTTSDEAEVRFRGGMVEFANNTITTGSGFLLVPWSTVGGHITGNTLNLGSQGFNVYGTSISTINMTGGNTINTENLADGSGYGLAASIRNLTVTGENKFTNSGSVSGTAVVLRSGQHAIVEVSLSGAHFQGFRNAFSMNHLTGFMGFKVNANDNHFEFPITAAPQAAQLIGILPTDEINLNHNIWGENSDAATVRSYISPAVGPVVLTEVTPP